MVLLRHGLASALLERRRQRRDEERERPVVLGLPLLVALQQLEALLLVPRLHLADLLLHARDLLRQVLARLRHVLQLALVLELTRLPGLRRARLPKQRAEGGDLLLALGERRLRERAARGEATLHGRRRSGRDLP